MSAKSTGSDPGLEEASSSLKGLIGSTRKILESRKATAAASKLNAPAEKTTKMLFEEIAKVDDNKRRIEASGDFSPDKKQKLLAILKGRNKAIGDEIIEMHSKDDDK